MNFIHNRLHVGRLVVDETMEQALIFYYEVKYSSQINRECKHSEIVNPSYV